MLKAQDRKEFQDFKAQFDLQAMLKEIDRDGDGIVETKDIPMIMAMFGEPKLLDEKFEKMKAELDPEDTGRFALDLFVERIGDFVDNYGTESEVIEAFRVFDKEKTGSIPINQFRYIMKHYAQLEDEKLDEIIMDIFKLRKLVVMDPTTPVEYLDFAKMIFE
jgi:Ca2+-binding EF-hand superfamily protein